MKRQSIMAAMFIISLAIGIIPALSQDKPASNMEVLREKIKADKKFLIAQNMQLTEAEAEKFWPVYKRFQKDLDDINKQTGQLISNYVDKYETLSDNDAEKMIKELFTIQEARMQLNKTYLPKFSSVLPMKKVARYYQLENKINAVVNYKLAEEIPLAK